MKNICRQTKWEFWGEPEGPKKIRHYVKLRISMEYESQQTRNRAMPIESNPCFDKTQCWFHEFKHRSRQVSRFAASKLIHRYCEDDHHADHY